MNVTEVIVPGKGRCNVIYNPVFDKGLKFNGGILLDMNCINLCIYRNDETKKDIQENDRDGKKQEIRGTKSIEFSRLETHGRILHKTS